MRELILSLNIKQNNDIINKNKMQLDHQELQKIDALIKRSEHILIISHKSPDGDTLGANLGLRQILVNMGKEVESLCIDPAADVFSFMPNIEMLRRGEPAMDFDAYFIVDAGATHLTGFHESHPRLFDKSMEVVNIDHHQSNDYYGKYNLVVPDAASATAVGEVVTGRTVSAAYGAPAHSLVSRKSTALGA